jgi:hypothetical protein
VWETEKAGEVLGCGEAIYVRVQSHACEDRAQATRPAVPRQPFRCQPAEWLRKQSQMHDDLVLMVLPPDLASQSLL